MHFHSSEGNALVNPLLCGCFEAKALINYPLPVRELLHLPAGASVGCGIFEHAKHLKILRCNSLRLTVDPPRKTDPLGRALWSQRATLHRRNSRSAEKHLMLGPNRHETAASASNQLEMPLE